jgi:hypothetical protein
MVDEQDHAPERCAKGRDSGERLRGITAFLPHFRAPGFEFGRWEEGREKTLGYWSYSDSAQEFHDAVYRFGWTCTDFNWGESMGTAEGRALFEDPGALERASPRQLAKLLTACVRGERFSEGPSNRHSNWG